MYTLQHKQDKYNILLCYTWTTFDGNGEPNVSHFLNFTIVNKTYI